MAAARLRYLDSGMPDRSARYLRCAIRGLVPVAGWSHSPVPWPYSLRRGRPHAIITGALYHAILLERGSVVSYCWGLPCSAVRSLRRRLAMRPRRRASRRVGPVLA